MNDDLFVGRQQELENLNALLKKHTASMVVVKGRRRSHLGNLSAKLNLIKINEAPNFWLQISALAII